MRAWYIIRTWPNQEGRAKVNLEQLDLGSGKLEKRVKWLKCRERVERNYHMVDTIGVLFPRYLFVALDLAVDRWHAILRTDRVSGMILLNEMPVALPGKDVQAWIDKSDSMGLVDFGRPLIVGRPSFRKGDTVRIKDGPFADHVGIFDGLEKGERANVFLSKLFGGQIVPLRENQIEAA